MIETRLLGGTGIPVSSFTLGTMVFGWKTAEKEAFHILDCAVDRGINLIDTSNSYGKGVSEALIGSWRTQNPSAAAKTHIATKFHYWTEGDNPAHSGSIRTHITLQCEESLRRLKLETIDLFQLHRPGAPEFLEDTLETLDLLLRAGKIRFSGSSTFSTQQILDSQEAARRLGCAMFASEQAPLNLLDRRAEIGVFPAANHLGMGILVWSPLAEGILTGKYTQKNSFPSDSRFSWVTKPGLYGARLTPSVLEAVERLTALATQKKITLSQLALAWVRRAPSVTSVILGPASLQQLQENLASLDVQLTREDLDLIDAITPFGTHLSPYYSSDPGSFSNPKQA